MLRFYRERIDDIQKRAKLIQWDLHWEIRDRKVNPEKPNEKVAILCFTHHAMLQEYTKILGMTVVQTDRIGKVVMTGAEIENSELKPIYNMFEIIKHASLEKLVWVRAN